MEVGVDIQENKAFKSFKGNIHFYKRIFTKKEIDYCIRRKDYKSAFCAKFCVKEAVIKIFDKKINYKEIEVLNTKSGKPYVLIKGEKRKNISVSLSHTQNYCVGVAVLKNV